MKAFAPTRGIFDDYGTLRIQSQLSNYSNNVIAGGSNIGNVSNFKKDDTNIFFALDRTPKREQQDNVQLVTDSTFLPINPDKSLKELLNPTEIKLPSGLVIQDKVPISSKTLRKQLDDLSTYQSKHEMTPLPGQASRIVRDLLQEQ